MAFDELKILSGGHPVLYFNAGIALSNMGLSSEAKEMLKKGLKKFPDDEELKGLLNELEDDSNSPDNGGNKPILGLVLLALLVRHRLIKK